MPNFSSPEHRLFFCMNIIYAKRMNSLSVQTQYWIMAISIIVFAITIITAVLAYKAGKKHGFLDAQVSENERMEHARKDAIERSRAVLSGQISEQLAPWLPDFPVNPSDARFIGKPIDFVAFCGTDEGSVSEIVFVEVKSGKSALSYVERSVRDAVVGGHVRWVEYRIE